MKKKYSKKVIIALVGILFIGIGVAFNAAALLGNDPVAIFYDGVRNVAGLTPEQLGLVSNIVNYGLILILCFIGKKYLNIGTLLYILPYGFFVNIGTYLYRLMIQGDVMYQRGLAVVFGCLLIYIGVGMFIAADIGLDPFTGITMVIRDALKWEFRKTKIAFDITLVVIGTLLGGKLGIITLITALTGGPGIQFFTGLTKKIFQL